MPHTIDQSLAVEGFFAQNLVQICPYRILICPVGHMCFDIPHHLYDLDIGTTMFGSLQGGKCCRNDRISIGSGRSHDSGGKGGVVTTAMLHMQHQCGVQYPRLQFGVLFVRAKHHQQILCGGKFLLGTVYVHTLIVGIVIICMVAVDCQHGEHSNQSQALS